MKKSLILFIAVTIALAACQPAATLTPSAQPTLAAPAALPQTTAYPAANTNPSLTQAAYPAQSGATEANNAMNPYPAPASGPGSAFPPADADSAMTRGNFLLDGASLQPSPDHPGQAELMATGSLPTPCNQLRVKLNPPDAQHKIIVEAYSVIEKDKVCTQNIKAFQGRLATLGGYPSGKYSVVVNDKPAGELSVP